MADIENIANKHLGRASDGTVVKPYETPIQIDPGLLVAVPRILNRTQYEIDENNLPFVGYDVWHCYEFSTLLDNGAPLTGLLKIVYPSNSPNIVESKSLKLYLNSFNMVRLGKSIRDVLINVEQQIIMDLSECIGHVVDLSLHIEGYTPDYLNIPTDLFIFKFRPIDTFLETINVSKYNEDPTILKVINNRFNNEQYHSSLLRSNCRVTNQPDWADVFIHIKNERVITSDSLLEYIISMRNENHFHEEICECIYKRLWDLLSPEELLVSCLYTRRGGIDINPIRASSKEIMRLTYPLQNSLHLTQRTMRQ